MAIVVEATVLTQRRPALRLVGGRLEVPAGIWPDGSGAAAATIARAAAAVARVEVENGVIPWVGTAFLVAPRLAITARYIGTLPARRGGDTGAETTWLNFADDPASGAARVAVASVEQVHPWWPFCFLRLASDAPVAPLALAPEVEFDSLADREVAAIGFHSFDQRNDAAVQRSLFGDLFDIKRASPGRIVGVRRDQADGPAMLLHDCSTLGGSGGAPLIDLASGEVLGVHVSGIYLRENRAACAWQARGDPQWEWLWTGSTQAARSLASSPPPTAPLPTSRAIFDFDEITAINDWLLQARITDEASLQTLFFGLSPEFVGSIPSASTIADRLALALDYLNDSRLRFGERKPLYYVLMNARRRRQFEPFATATMDRFVDKARG